MMKTELCGKPIAVFAEQFEPAAWAQLANAMAHPAAVKAAVMPDIHAGYSLPIGSVAAARDTIFPSWVGYDIGCGCCAAPLNVTADQVRPHAKLILDEIYAVLPVGSAHNREANRYVCPPQAKPTGRVEGATLDDCSAQKGSLGSGNHFLEVGADEDGRAWIVVHSGSRNVGHKVASHYMRVASGTDKPKEGAYGLEVESELGRAYIQDMTFALNFALANRLAILERGCQAIQSVLGRRCEYDGGELINRNHNHAEFHAESGLWIHRKGATHAEAGMRGVIPGNMRDGSFIVTGLGSSDALWSSSHGAGRVMGRAQAKKNLSIEEFADDMRGVAARVGADTIDESPRAYKDIFEVMEKQSDLVAVTHHVTPILNIKG